MWSAVAQHQPVSVTKATSRIWLRAIRTSQDRRTVVEARLIATTIRPRRLGPRVRETRERQNRLLLPTARFIARYATPCSGITTAQQVTIRIRLSAHHGR